MGIPKKTTKMEKLSGKYEILTFQGGKISHIGNKTNMILETRPFQREAEGWILKAAKMLIKAHIEKEKYL